MKKLTTVIGIDISKHTLDACLLNQPGDKQPAYLQVSNSTKGIQQVLTLISKQGIHLKEVLFCFETTGVYGMTLCYFLQSKNIDYCMVPAIEIKRSKGLTRGKSDKVDALSIARYAFTHSHKLRLSSLPEKDLMELKLLLTEREKLIKAIGIFKTTGEAEAFLPKHVIRQVMKSNLKTIKTLKTQVAHIDKLILNIIHNNEVMLQQYNLATSVPGVGQQTAVNLIVTTRCFTAFANWRKLACYAGIAPFEYSSGVSIRGRTKVNHMANKKLKSLLNMAALSAKRHDHQLKAYYERKIGEGKNGMVVMNALRCKVVSRVFATVKRGTPFVDIQKFAA